MDGGGKWEGGAVLIFQGECSLKLGDLNRIRKERENDEGLDAKMAGKKIMRDLCFGIGVEGDEEGKEVVL